MNNEQWQEIKKANENAQPLTLEDIKYLRKADTIIFEYFTDYNGTPKAQARGMKTIRTRDSRETVTLFEIPIKADFDVSYSNLCHDYQDRFKRASSYHDYINDKYGRAESVLSSILATLRKGDRLTILFEADYGNGYTQNARTASDHEHHPNQRLNTYRTYLLIERGKKTYKYMLRQTVMPDNTASPIRFY